MTSSLLQFTGYSIYCPIADVHIDPWKGVDRAIITHAHSDHARWGSKHYLAHTDSESILRLRLGEDINLQTIPYNKVVTINGVSFSLHPAGHIIGSAQVRVEYKGQVWVVSGDYKREDDHVCEPFEPVKCHVFITESTFGLPIYRWQPQEIIFTEIREWHERNKREGKTSLLMGYALGKIQRILKNVPFDEPIYAHGAVYAVNERLRQGGLDMPELVHITKDTDRKQLAGSIIVAPPGAEGSPWSRKFPPLSIGYCSGWMRVRGIKNRRGIDQGFALSDHVDWDQLNQTIKDTSAEKVYVTHGFTSVYAKWLNEQGIDAAEVKTMYGDEKDEVLDSGETENTASA